MTISPGFRPDAPDPVPPKRSTARVLILVSTILLASVMTTGVATAAVLGGPMADTASSSCGGG